MLYLILLTFAVFVIFWLGDLILTLQTVKHMGVKAEVNPIMRGILKTRGKFIYIFKIIEIGAFLYLLYFISTFKGIISFNILLFFILFYSLLVVNNAHVYYKVTHKESKTLSIVFIFLIITMLLFIYLNFLLYQDLGVSFTALSKSNQRYADLYEECNQNQTIESSLPQDLGDLLRDLNLPIRGVGK